MSDIRVRNAIPADRQRLANLIHFEEYVHRHLDWKAALDWIGSSPYLIAEIQNALVAALACPADPPGVAWVRLFTVASGLDLDETWQVLWDKVQNQLSGIDSVQVYALTLQDWFTQLLTHQGFDHVQDVMVLVWEAASNELTPPNDRLHLRPMRMDDLLVVSEIDHMAFGLEWRNSRSALTMALEQSAVASVVEKDDQIIGYQISTSSAMGGHLARLAVNPHCQCQGVGTYLVQSLLSTFQARGVDRVTVNTQADNLASLAIYRKNGFQMTGESYPVFRLMTI